MRHGLKSEKYSCDRQLFLLIVFGTLLLGCLAFQQLPETFETVLPEQTMFLFGEGSQLKMSGAPPGEAGNPQVVTAELTPFFFMPIPINRADTDLLQTVPGIGPKMASKIITYRLASGPIRDTEDLLYINGIGPVRAGIFEKYISYK